LFDFKNCILIHEDTFYNLVAESKTQVEGTGGVSYVLQDWQGSVRASINNNGFIQARFDFTAFGEEISLGVGLRGIEQGYSGDATTRQGYGLTEKDSSGLNHTWFRKQEQRAGRWTSPDPYKGSMELGNPQSFNRYSYVNGQPTNFVDPSGLYVECRMYTWVTITTTDGVEISRVETGPRWIECTSYYTGGTSPSTVGHQIFLPDLGATNSTPQNDPDESKIQKALNCLAEKLGALEKAYHEGLVDQDEDLVKEQAKDIVVGGGVGSGVGYIIAKAAGDIVAAMSATASLATIAVMGYVNILFDDRKRTRKRKQFSKDASTVFKDCVTDAGLTPGTIVGKRKPAGFYLN
jgi:RHS repeat-associated protein